MRVLVKRDSATTTPVDVGEGPDADKKILALVKEHGANVTKEDGSPIEIEKPVEKKAKPARSHR